MEQINTNLLNKNLAISDNKKAQAGTCDNTMLQLFKSKTNLFYFAKNEMSLYELSQWLISFKFYMLRKNGNTHVWKLAAGQELIVDFGFACGEELAYKHHAIVLSSRRSKLFVVPLTTQTHKAYNNGQLRKDVAIAGLKEGFDKDGVVLLLNDARWISSNRIVNTTQRKLITKYIEELKKMILQRTLGSIYQKMEKLIADNRKLSSVIDRKQVVINHKNDEITKLNEKISRIELELQEK